MFKRKNKKNFYAGNFPDWKVADIAQNILDRMDDEYYEEGFEEDILNCLDAELIYTDDQWAILAGYCTPQEANFTDAMEEFQINLFDFICGNYTEE